ncbi:hypothetical protein ACFVIL_00620 [Streptomyces sp. NPDC127159]|uniref:hypothetical protein n=1 Tax=unclassified Streptomyces TaxID=2593676 RepID=UPI0036332637
MPPADCRRAPDTPRGERTPRATNPPEAEILAIGRGRPGSSRRFAEGDVLPILHQQGELDQVVSIRHVETHSLQPDISAWSGSTTL